MQKDFNQKLKPIFDENTEVDKFYLIESRNAR